MLYVKKARSWLLCAAWMGVIYFMSAMSGDVSDGQSDMVLEGIRMFLGSGSMATAFVEMIDPIFRKAAHMAEYAVLFLLYRHALSLSGVKRSGLTALLLSTCYAATDEWHQSFVADRASSVVDVGIDTLGAAMAWGIQEIITAGKNTRKKER